MFADAGDGRPAILPTIKALGEFDEGGSRLRRRQCCPFRPGAADPELDRLLLLAPVVQAWKRQLPAHVAKMFEEEVVVPVSTANSLWLARDLARLMDDVETEQSDWAKLASLVADDYAGWWQVTLKFLEIVTDFWPQRLVERGQSNPAAHRNALIGFEAERLRRNPPADRSSPPAPPARSPQRPLCLRPLPACRMARSFCPAWTCGMDDASWAEIATNKPEPPVVGHSAIWPRTADEKARR